MPKPLGDMNSLAIRASRAVLVLSFFAFIGCDKADQKTAAPPPPAVVKIAEAVSRDVPITVDAVGQTRGNAEIDISARVEGFLETVDFKDGTFVKKGQRLYTIDNRPFLAALAEAKAKVAQSQAEALRVHQDVVRYEPLVAKNAVSVQDLETAKANERAQQSAVAAAQAAVQKAQIDLGYTTVLAPDSGLIGVTEVFPGTLVGKGNTTLLTKMSKIDPIKVRFSVSERDYLFYAKRREARLVASGAAGNGAGANSALGSGDDGSPPLQFQMILADGSTHPYPGTLSFVDRNVDDKTGTIRLEASFPNPGNIVRPGQFARVRAAVSLKKNAVLVTQGAVVEAQGINSVAVVKPDDTVEMRVVKPAERIGSLVILDSGLKAGERIVVEGIQKVRAGAKVKPTLVPLEDAPAADSSAAAPSPAPSASGAASGG
ncbi:MAG TPA: efflux RND transporter periplasmic adaptor subunit [Polyangiaceae bacterium]|nr:efflux RND transporter periplasmic adaptor subunit [Polyangiaceae bacterium]